MRGPGHQTAELTPVTIANHRLQKAGVKTRLIPEMAKKPQTPGLR